MGLQDREYYRDEETPGMRLSGSRMMVTNILVVTIGIFIVDAFTEVVPGTRTNWLAHALSLKGNLLQEPWHIWQLLTSGFAHASLGDRSIWHVGGNMFMLWMFGYDVERRLGRLEFLRFYLTAIVIASSCWLALTIVAGQADRSSLLGASGGISAMFALFVFMNPKRTLFLMGIIPLPTWVVGVLFLLSDVMGQMTGGDNVAYSAHLGGAAFGAAYFLLRWNLGRVVPDRLFEFKKLARRPPSLKVHDPEQVYENRDAEADRVLDKLHSEGEDSLTPKERRVLEDYSRRMRQKHR